MFFATSPFFVFIFLILEKERVVAWKEKEEGVVVVVFVVDGGAAGYGVCPSRLVNSSASTYSICIRAFRM